MTIIDFLEARIAEDEATTQAAIDSPTGAGGHWVSCFRQIEGAAHTGVADTQSSWYADHIVRFDPDRVLAECSAKRAIMAMFKPEDVEREWNPEAYVAGAIDDCIRALASVYKDHPDYRQEWAA